METSTTHGVALCPKCGARHDYDEVKYVGGENDRGCWQVECGCTQNFLLKIRNPIESSASFNVVNQFFEDDPLPDLPGPGDAIIHTLPKSDYAPIFGYEETALYRCAENQANLEVAAFEALKGAFTPIRGQLAAGENFLLSGRLDAEHSVIHVKVPCGCGKDHVATFYQEMRLGVDEPIEPEDFLLADITGVNLQDTLSGLVSKTEAMEILSKLLIRWHLVSDQIIVAAPFVGHNRQRSADKQKVWTWLLEKLDPDYAVLITRAATLREFKELDGDAPPFQFLQKFGIENKVVSADTKFQKSHAKVYAGVSAQGCEVLSGSANLVPGPSLENISFTSISAERWQRQYMDRISMSLPEPRRRPRTYLGVFQDAEGKWCSNIKMDSRLPSTI